MPQSDPSRTERATPKRKEKAREEGNVPKSQEVSKVAILLGGFILVWLLFGVVARQITGLFQWFFGPGLSLEVSQNSFSQLVAFVSLALIKMLLPILLSLALVAFVSVRLQVGGLWTTKVFVPKMSKFNPVKGVQKLFFSTQTIVRLLRSLFMTLAVGIAPYFVLKSEMHNFVPLFYQDVDSIVAYMLKTGSIMVILALIPMLLIALGDLIYTRWDYEENLKMTKDETKDETKQSEGDPKVKAAQRKKMFSAMQQRMMEKIPQADVVITNPTHFAVALRYNPTEAPAPLVLAKGAGHIALKIKELAREHNVPIKEDKPLAQALYKTVEIGDTIPEDLYQAVASILANLHKFKRRPNG
ncbi:MAG: flagellar biosynthesis protein FlhB [Desulfovibrionales bacterium]